MGERTKEEIIKDFQNARAARKDWQKRADANEPRAHIELMKAIGRVADLREKVLSVLTFDEYVKLGMNED